MMLSLVVKPKLCMQVADKVSSAMTMFAFAYTLVD